MVSGVRVSNGGVYTPPDQNKDQAKSPDQQSAFSQGQQSSESKPKSSETQSSQSKAYQPPYVPGVNGNKSNQTASQNASGVESDSKKAASASGEVRSVNGKLVDANGNPKVLKGYNVWDPKNATLSDPNLNAVRFNQQDWAGGNRDEDAFLKNAKDYAEKHPGQTIILGHRAPGMAGSENQDRKLSPDKLEDGVKFWEKASKMFKDNPNVVFNLENEIGLKGQDNPEVFGYYQKLIPAARSGGATNPLLIGDNGFGQGSVTAGTSIQDDFLANYGSKLRKLDPQDNIIASIHPYNPESYDKLTQVVGAIKKNSGLPVIADEFGDHQNPSDPQWVQKAAKEGVLDGLLFWGGPDLTGAQDISNFQKNWKPFLASLPEIGPQDVGDTTSTSQLIASEIAAGTTAGGGYGMTTAGATNPSPTDNSALAVGGSDNGMTSQTAGEADPYLASATGNSSGMSGLTYSNGLNTNPIPNAANSAGNNSNLSFGAGGGLQSATGLGGNGFSPSLTSMSGFGAANSPFESTGLGFGGNGLGNASEMILQLFSQLAVLLQNLLPYQQPA